MIRRRKRRTCGDYGGATVRGEPCSRPMGWGTSLEVGRCRDHAEPAIALSELGTTDVDVESEPPGWLDGIQHPKKAGMLRALALTGVVAQAARAAQIDRSTHYAWTNPESEWYDPEYAARVPEAMAAFADTAEAAAIRRGRDGWEEPVIYQGQPQFFTRTNENGVEVREPVTVRRFSDTCLMAVLNAHKPDTYGRNYRISGPGGGPIPVAHQVRVRIPDNGRGMLPAPDDAAA